jgi:hypothetical protein
VLQIAAWAKDAKEPSLLVDSTRFAMSQAFMMNDVVALEFGGGGANILFVLVFRNGRPEVALQEGFKAYTAFRTDWRNVQVTIPDGAGGTRVVTFPSGNE